MSEELVPPGALPAAGWYPDPGDPSGTRYWDGATWTDQVAAGPVPAPPVASATPPHSSSYRSGSGLGIGAFVGAAFGVVALILVVVALASRGSGSEAGVGTESAATYVCREFVRDRLQSPTSATFSAVHGDAPVAGTQWIITGTVESRSIQGELTDTGFTCTVEPSANGYWHLVRLRFTDR